MSTTRGRQALDALKSVRAFYSEVSRLIGTADHWLGAEAGWRTHNATVLRDMSYSIDVPSNWQPEAVDRWYLTRDPHIAGYLVVILLPRDTGLRFDEPLISAGWVRSARPVKYNDPPRWLSYMAMWRDVLQDGTLHAVELESTPDKFGRMMHRFPRNPGS